MNAFFTTMEFPTSLSTNECMIIKQLVDVYTNKATIYYHMSDNDGKLSGEMLGKLFGNSTLVPFTYHREITTIGTLMVFVDVTPDFDQLEDLYYRKCGIVQQILIIDHHKDRFDYYSQKLKYFDSLTAPIIYIYSDMPATYMVGKIVECLHPEWYTRILNTVVEAVSLYDVPLNDKPNYLFWDSLILRTPEEKNCSEACYDIEFWCRSNSMQIIDKCRSVGLLQSILSEGHIIKDTYSSIAKQILDKYRIDLSNKMFIGRFEPFNKYIDNIVMCNVPNYDFSRFFESKPNEIAIAFTYVDINKISVNCFSSKYNLLELCPGLGGHPSEAGCEIQELSQLFVEK